MIQKSRLIQFSTIFVILSAVNVANASAFSEMNSIQELSRRCLPDSPSDQNLYSSDFRWNYLITEIKTKYFEIYQSGKRLPQKMYWDPAQKTLMVPVIGGGGSPARVPKNFIESVRLHIERAVEARYVDGIFFPDMGHSHFYVPTDRFKEITSVPNEKRHLIYEGFFNEPELKILYHTAEQISLLGENRKPRMDRASMWRFITRNILGDNQARGDLQILQTEPGDSGYDANTVSEIPHFARYGAGFNISASQKGCYAFRISGRVEYFDLSLSDLEPDPSFPVVD